MQKAGKLLVKNLKTLVTGSSTRLGDAITKNLLNKGATVYSMDKRILTNERINSEHHFVQGDLAQENFLSDYLKTIPNINAVVNCAGFRSSYNYYLTYLISKNILEKFRENDINEFGCRGCLINLVFMSSQYDEEYFKEQDEFAKKYNISTETIDDDVYQLADQLTAARIRCNTVLVNSKTENKLFTDLITHIIEDQYIAGQVINLEDDLKKDTIKMRDLLDEIHIPPTREKPEEPYTTPAVCEPKQIDSKTITLKINEPVKP